MSTPQQPIGSGLGFHTTAVEALGGRDLRGKIAVVTGGYSGLGLEATRALAGAGAHVVVPARTADKARAALAGVANVELAALDLGDPASIDAFAASFIASGRPLDMLVNSAGIMAAPFHRDVRGFESQLATNHLGHFQLTARLWPALVAAKGARVVSVSSRGHRLSGIVFDDPHFEHRAYDKWKAYGQSKTANVLFAVALDARGAAHGVRAFALHPGGILTDLVRFMTADEQRAMGVGDPARAHEFKTAQEGAATIVWCAANQQLEGLGGVYCEDCDVAKVVHSDIPGPSQGVRPHAVDPEAAERLWGMSEGWMGGEFPI